MLTHVVPGLFIPYVEPKFPSGIILRILKHFFFNISCSARLLIINSVSFHMPEKVFMSPSVFKEVFLGCRRLDGCFNSFRALKTFRCHLACLCSAVIPIFFQIRMKHEIYISYAFFLPGCFYIFLFITGFKRFD